ncbi:MAG TPA: hypothetical protein DCS56_00935, partial [Alcanivorax sp.]|nr:hypothetical protein [Alcanivorax sp.]
ARFRVVLLHLTAVTCLQQGGETLQRGVLGLFIAGAGVSAVSVTSGAGRLTWIGGPGSGS